MKQKVWALACPGPSRVWSHVFSLQPDLSFLHFEDLTLLPKQFAHCSLPPPLHFLMRSNSLTLLTSYPLLEEKTSILFLSSYSIPAHFSKPIQIAKEAFPATTTNSNLPSLMTSLYLLVVPPTLPLVFNFLRISMFAAFYLEDKDCDL